MSVIQALLIAVFYGLAKCNTMVFFCGYLWNMPLVMGFIFGAIMGDITTGVILGANIMIIYLGIVYYGAVIPADMCMASCIAIPLAIATGLDTETALALAVPFGALGAAIVPLTRTLNTSIWGPYVDKQIEKLNYKGIYLGSSLWPLLMTMAYTSTFIFVVLYFGADAIDWLLKNLPQTLINGFSNMGSILPALGFATFIHVIGKPKLIPFFVIGFYVMAFFNLPVFGAAVFGAFLAFLAFTWGGKEETAVEEA